MLDLMQTLKAVMAVPEERIELIGHELDVSPPPASPDDESVLGTILHQ